MLEALPPNTLGDEIAKTTSATLGNLPMTKSATWATRTQDRVSMGQGETSDWCVGRGVLRWKRLVRASHQASE